MTTDIYYNKASNRQMYKKILVVLLPLLLAACGSQEGDSKVNEKRSASGHKMGDTTQKLVVKKPKVPFKYGLGMRKFRDTCSSCHGVWGEGSEQGPPLIHPFYVPSHHGDKSFYSAALKGVNAHHWKFGDMPPAQGVTSTDMDKIVPFIRWLQKENGIY